MLLTYCLGKPSNISLENNVDWVPSRNMNNLDAVQQCDYNQDALDSSENAPSIYNIAYNSTDDSNITASPDECIGNNPLAKTNQSIKFNKIIPHLTPNCLTGIFICWLGISSVAIKFRTQIGSIIYELKKLGISNAEEWKLGDLLKYFESDFTHFQNNGTVAY